MEGAGQRKCPPEYGVAHGAPSTPSGIVQEHVFISCRTGRERKLLGRTTKGTENLCSGPASGAMGAAPPTSECPSHNLCSSTRPLRRHRLMKSDGSREQRAVVISRPQCTGTDPLAATHISFRLSVHVVRYTKHIPSVLVFRHRHSFGLVTEGEVQHARRVK